MVIIIIVRRRTNWIRKALMSKRYQKNVECVVKEMSQSLT